MNSTSCDACMSIVGLVSAEVNLTNVTVAALSKAVLGMCAVLGTHIVNGECKFIVDRIDDIVGWLASGMTNAHVCQKLKLCKMSASAMEY